MALRRLVDLCIEQRAAFLLLAGDVYDGQNGSLAARLEFRAACARLGENGVLIFWARGNHDPLFEADETSAAARPADFIQWPDNLKVFGSLGRSFYLSGRDTPHLTGGALVHGISHTRERVRENLALRLKQTAEAARSQPPAGFAGPVASTVPAAPVFEIAVLHCALSGRSEGHEGYAPCSLADLTSQPIH